MVAPGSTDWIEDKYKTHVVCVVNHIEQRSGIFLRALDGCGKSLD